MAFNGKEMDCRILARSQNRRSVYSEPSFFSLLSAVWKRNRSKEKEKIRRLTFISTAKMNTNRTQTYSHFPSINKKSDSVKSRKEKTCFQKNNEQRRRKKKSEFQKSVHVNITLPLSPKWRGGGGEGQREKATERERERQREIPIGIKYIFKAELNSEAPKQ